MSELLGHELMGEGDGDVVLLGNGGMMSHAAWAPITTALLADYRVLGCDFRGQLLSPGEGHRRIEDHVPDVVALLDKLALDAVHVLGTSFGGEVGLLLAARHPERVKTLATVASVDRTPPGMRDNSRALAEEARAVAAGGDPAAFHDAITRDVYSPAYRRDHADDLADRLAKIAALPAAWYQGLLGILESIEDFDLTPELGRIGCPTLVVHAAQDAVMPEERVRALAAAIPDAELRVHPTAGHALFAEDPDWLIRVYRDFLVRRGAAAG